MHLLLINKCLGQLLQPSLHCPFSLAVGLKVGRLTPCKAFLSYMSVCCPPTDYLKQDSVITAKPRDCEAALEHIEEKYGTVVGYLLSCGLTEEELQRIRVNMLMEAVLIQIPRAKYASMLDSVQDSEPEYFPSVSSMDTLTEVQSSEQDFSETPLLRQSSSVPDLRLESSACLED